MKGEKLYSPYYPNRYDRSFFFRLADLKIPKQICQLIER